MDDIMLLGSESLTDNLLGNGSFEYDEDGDNYPDIWMIKEPVALENTDRTHGQYCAIIESTAVINNINRQYVDVKPNTTYILSAWVKTEDVTRQCAQVYPYNYDGVLG